MHFPIPERHIKMERYLCRPSAASRAGRSVASSPTQPCRREIPTCLGVTVTLSSNRNSLTSERCSSARGSPIPSQVCLAMTHLPATMSAQEACAPTRGRSASTRAPVVPSLSPDSNEMAVSPNLNVAQCAQYSGARTVIANRCTSTSIAKPDDFVGRSTPT